MPSTQYQNVADVISRHYSAWEMTKWPYYDLNTTSIRIDTLLLSSLLLQRLKDWGAETPKFILIDIV